MSENANKSKSSLGMILTAILCLAIGFAAGHIASDMGLIKGAPKLPEAKPSSGNTPSTPRDHDGRDIPEQAEEAVDEAEDAVNDAAQKAEEVVDDAKKKLDDATGG